MPQVRSLTKEQILEIYLSPKGLKETAEIYGCTATHIYHIRNGEIYKDVFREHGHEIIKGPHSPRARRLTKDQILEIYLNPKGCAEVASYYPVVANTIRRIREGDLYKDIFKEHGDKIVNKPRKRK